VARIERVLLACSLLLALGSAARVRAQEWSVAPLLEDVPWSTATFVSASTVTSGASPHADLMCRVASFVSTSSHQPTVLAATETLRLEPSATAIDGASALARFHAHWDAQRWPEAAVALETARVASPVLADRFALLRADLEMETGATADTCARYEEATASPLPAIGARARLGRVRCLLVTDSRHAEEELDALRRRYHDLPEERLLDLDHAAYLERRGNLRGAIEIYDAMDRGAPGSPEAARARDALSSLAASGERLPVRTTLAEVDRLERLARSGPPELARTEAERLHTLTAGTHLGSRVTLVLARLARVEGRFEDASTLMREARAVDPTVGDDPVLVEAQATDLADAARGHLESAARDDLRRLGYSTRTLRHAPTMRLATMVRVAARAGLREETTALVAEVARRTTTTCLTRFDVAIFASGTTDDESLVTLLEPCATGTTEHAIAARYHRARALERLGRTEEARTELEAITTSDTSDTQIYAVLARARLEADTATPARPPHLDTEDGKEDESAAAAAIDVGAALTALAARHTNDFPWIGRAAALVALGDEQAASDELFQTYLAWAQALGRTPLRAGLEAVYRGAAATRVPSTAEQRRDRRALPDLDRRLLADVADALGDPGLAIRFDSARSSGHPRAFAQFVEAAAARHGLDPNLLFAVMRVESIYNPRIVSYAGAIGLLQIMPRTGRLIAHSMGREDFTVDELLDPETNVELAAWYLASLIERFDGRLPLAIAAYNGGPHNVRRWLADHSPTLPVDALMEHIPFEQTYRYVRRVLSHYAAYRADAGLPPATLELEQPVLQPDVTAF
jgi:soluble lytic murein transglycosylase-like protein